MTICLRKDNIHVCYVSIEDCVKQGLLPGYMGLLDDGERERLDRLAEHRARTEFLVTRALCRVMLSQFVDRPPSAWRFDVNAYGKPCLPDDDPASSIDFNLSNTKELVVCAIGTSCHLGIDIEPYTQARPVEAMAKRFFASAEVDQVMRAAPADRMARFIEIWTLKEAFIKAWGTGMSLPLDTFSFDTTGFRPVPYFHDARFGDPAHWRFHAWDNPPAHRTALAIDMGRPSGSLRVDLRHAIPRLWGPAGQLDVQGPGGCFTLDESDETE